MLESEVEKEGGLCVWGGGGGGPPPPPPPPAPPPEFSVSLPGGQPLKACLINLSLVASFSHTRLGSHPEFKTFVT